jgi:hypothetical protein
MRGARYGVACGMMRVAGVLSRDGGMDERWSRVGFEARGKVRHGFSPKHAKQPVAPGNRSCAYFWRRRHMKTIGDDS